MITLGFRPKAAVRFDSMNSAIHYNDNHDNESLALDSATGFEVQGNLLHHNRSGVDHGSESGAGNVPSRTVSVKNEDNDISFYSSFVLSIDGLDVTATNLTSVAQ